MSWIKVKKDNKEYLVSTESYREVFSHQGYEIVSEKANPTPNISKIENKPKEVENELRPRQNGNANKGKHKAEV